MRALIVRTLVLMALLCGAVLALSEISPAKAGLGPIQTVSAAGGSTPWLNTPQMFWAPEDGSTGFRVTENWYWCESRPAYGDYYPGYSMSGDWIPDFYLMLGTQPPNTPASGNLWLYVDQPTIFVDGVYQDGDGNPLPASHQQVTINKIRGPNAYTVTFDNAGTSSLDPDGITSWVSMGAQFWCGGGPPYGVNDSCASVVTRDDDMLNAIPGVFGAYGQWTGATWSGAWPLDTSSYAFNIAKDGDLVFDHIVTWRVSWSDNTIPGSDYYEFSLHFQGFKSGFQQWDLYRVND